MSEKLQRFSIICYPNAEMPFGDPEIQHEYKDTGSLVEADEAEAALEERDGLITALRSNYRGAMADVDHFEELARTRKARIAELEALVPKWISVDGKHPKETPLMVLTCDKIQLIGIYHCGYSNWRDCYGRELQHVTHWAYPPVLPTPPEGAGDAREHS